MPCGGFVVDADEPIEVEFFGLEPGFELFAGRGVEFDEHFAAVHGDQDAESLNRLGGVEAGGKFLGTLASEAGHGVLG